MNEARTRLAAFGTDGRCLLLSPSKVAHVDGVFTQTNSGYQEKGQYVSLQDE